MSKEEISLFSLKILSPLVALYKWHEGLIFATVANKIILFDAAYGQLEWKIAKKLLMRIIGTVNQRAQHVKMIIVEILLNFN